MDWAEKKEKSPYICDQHERETIKECEDMKPSLTSKCGQNKNIY